MLPTTPPAGFGGNNPYVNPYGGLGWGGTQPLGSDLFDSILKGYGSNGFGMSNTF
jgi:hypothetical protein